MDTTSGAKGSLHHCIWEMMKLFFFLITSVVGSAAAVVPSGGISQLKDAKLFQIYYGQSFKVIKNYADGNSYLLMQNNSGMASSRTRYCTGRIKSFVIPVANYSLDTAAGGLPGSFFELLGLVDRLKGITSELVTSACVLQSFVSGGIQLLNRTDTQQFSRFTVHLVNSINKAQSCNFAAFVPMAEKTPLQRAEWIKYLGTFSNSEARANTVYDAVRGNYMCLSKMATNLTYSFKPIVAWVDYSEGIWSFTKEAYKLQFVVDAGGENLDDSITNNHFNTANSYEMENFYAILSTVDVVIDETYASEPVNYTLSTFLENINIGDNSSFGFLVNQSLWRYDKRALSSSLDWFDGAISQPQLVLADLIEVFFPRGNYTTTYFRNLAKEERVTTITPEMCDKSKDMSLDPPIVPCW